MVERQEITLFQVGFNFGLKESEREGHLKAGQKEKFI